jgi:hypothetical protein
MSGAISKQTRALIDTLDRERVRKGVCRHCGGPVPCWSPYGDVAVGVRRKLEVTKRKVNQ